MSLTKPALNGSLDLPCFALSALCCMSQLTGQSLQFTHLVNSHVDVPYDPAMVPQSGITVEAWITYDEAGVPAGMPFHWPTIARQNVTPGSESWLLRVDAAHVARRDVKFSVQDGIQQLRPLVWSFAPGELASWTHIAATYDGQWMRLYKNGVEVQSAFFSAQYPLQDSGGVLRIGNGDLTNPGYETWSGKIDELRVWPMARTAAEIRATMHQQLSGVPGGVISFGFNGHLIDTSRFLVGAPTGSIPFVSGAPLLPVAISAAKFGSETNWCSRGMGISIGSSPSVGNADFAVWCVEGPVYPSASMGLLLLGDQMAPVSQPPVLGLAIHIDMAASTALLPFVPGSIGLGVARFPLPIPNQATLSGSRLFGQFILASAGCGPNGLTSSQGLDLILN